MLVVLVGLDGDAGKGAGRLDAAGFAQVAVAGVEAVGEQLLDVNLAAGRGQGQEVEVVDVDVAFFVGAGELGGQKIVLIEGLGRLAAVAEHGSHRRIAVDIGVFALQVEVLGIREGKVLQGVHEAGLHLADAGAFVAIEDIGLGRTGMAVFDEHLFHKVLNVFHVRRVVAFGFKDIENLIGQMVGHGAVGTALGFGRTEDGFIYLGDIESDDSRISFSDEAYHGFS